MGHPQPPTPMQLNNTTSVGFSNITIKQNHSKAIDMQFYWFQDRTKQGQLVIYWRPGNQNIGDYQNKHHSPSYHWLMRPVYLHDTESLVNTLVSTLLWGCVIRVNSVRAHACRQTQYTVIQNPETKEIQTQHTVIKKLVTTFITSIWKFSQEVSFIEELCPETGESLANF